MAFYKVPSNIANSILAFVKRLVSKTLYKAFDVILSPCCTLSGVAEAVCDSEDLHTITVTTNETIGFLGKGYATMIINGTDLKSVVTEPNTIVFSSVDAGTGTFDGTVTVFLPTSSDEAIGVYKTFVIADIVLPSCA